MSFLERASLAATLLAPVGIAVSLLVGMIVDHPAAGATAALTLFALMVTAALTLGFSMLADLRRSRRANGACERDGGEVNGWQSSALVEGASFLLSENPGAEWLRWLWSLGKFSPQAVLAHGLATRSNTARDYLALRATGWKFDAGTLKDLLQAADGDPVVTRHAVGACDPNALVMLSRLLRSQQTRSDDLLYAGLLQRLAHTHAARLSTANRRLLAHQMMFDGEVTSAADLLEGNESPEYPDRFLSLDLINPFNGAAPKSTEAIWLAAVSGIFRRAGLEPICLLPTGATPFDRLCASAPQTSEKGPKVTVIMTCFEPGHGLFTAVRSMINQTWQNWELIVTDDASPSSPDTLLEQVALMDKRVRVVRNSVNAGTYVRRNEALDLATGEFVTMQDSDDWVHPRRLEIQMRHLIDNPQIPANLSQSVRVSEDLVFVQPRGLSLRLTESSILFRRDVVREMIGYFDTVRKAADSEFRERLEATIGRKIPLVDVEAPLSLVRLDSGSLTGGDIADGWMHPARVAYRGSMREWRRARLAKKMPLKLESDLPNRPFPAHGHLTGHGPSTHHLDVLYMFDPRSDTGGTQDPEAVARELKHLASEGVRVGVRRALEITSHRAAPEAAPAVQELINDGLVMEVLSVDHVVADLAVVRYVSSLTAVSEIDEAVMARELLLVTEGAVMPKRVIEQASRLLVGSDGPSPICVSGEVWAARLEELVRTAPDTGTVPK